MADIELPTLDRVYMTAECWAQLQFLLDEIDTEFGLLGLVKMKNGGLPCVDKLYCPRQYVTKSSVDFDTGSFHGILEDVQDKGRANDLRVSIHSHQSLPTSWSVIDMETIHYTLREGGMPWSISIVMNKKYDFKARLDVYEFSLDGDRIMPSHLATELDLILEVPNNVRKFFHDAVSMLEEPPRVVRSDPQSSIARHSQASKAAAKQKQQQGQKQLTGGATKSPGSSTSEQDSKTVDDPDLEPGVAYVYDDKKKKLIPDRRITYSSEREEGTTTVTDQVLQVGDDVEGEVVEDRDPKEVERLRSTIKVVE